MKPGITIFDLEGLSLTQEERELLQHPAAAGVILFSRNYQNISQLQRLTSEIKSIRSNLMIAVDQEGGRVQRFCEGFSSLPAMEYWGQLYAKSPSEAAYRLKDAISTLSLELKNVGVNTNLIPVLDLNHGISNVIGSRSLSSNPAIVIELGKIAVQALHEHGMPAVGKHFPGHGGVVQDSHTDVPVDSRDWAEIEKSDMRPFVELTHDLNAIMPAHVIYSSIDDIPATFSRRILTKILRQQIGFKGLIISDDLTMHAAASVGSYSDRARMALEAGCNRLLVCNNREGAIEVLQSLE